MPKEKREVILVEGVPDWLVTFGDMMSLLLTFFILLFSISELKEPGKIFDLAQTFQAHMRSKRPVVGYTLPRIEMGPDGMLNQMQDKPNQMGEAGTSSNKVQTSEGDSIYARTIRDNLHLQLKGSVQFQAREGISVGRGTPTSQSLRNPGNCRWPVQDRCSGTLRSRGSCRCDRGVRLGVRACTCNSALSGLQRCCRTTYRGSIGGLSDHHSR